MTGEQMMFDFGDPPKVDGVKHDGKWVYYLNSEPGEYCVAIMDHLELMEYLDEGLQGERQ